MNKTSRRQFSDKRPSPESSVVPTIYGIAPVLEALRSASRPIEQIIFVEGGHNARYREISELAKARRILINRLPRTAIARYAAPEANHQGVFAVIAAAKYANGEELLDEISAQIGTSENPLTVVLDGLEDPRNLGAIARTVECVGARGIFLPERRAVGLTETVSKTAAGALEYVKVAKVTNLTRLLEEMKERGIWTVGTSADAKMNYTEWDWRQPTALVLGSEGKGLHRLVAENCDALVKIPLLGAIESLNVSVAAGVILYEARRQRRESLEKQ